MLYEITAQSFSQNAQAYEIAADIPTGQGRTALLFAHGVRAGAGEAEYELAAPPGWTPLGVASAATTNRRYVTAVWAMPEPSAGLMNVRIEATRKLSGLVAFLVLVDATPGAAMAATGPAGELAIDGSFPAGAIVAVTGRPGTVIEEPLLAQSETDESNTSTAVWAGLFAAGPDARATAQKGGLLSLLAVPLAAPDEPDEPPPPLALKNEISVIVRDVPPGGSHEVRHVRPGDLVVRNGDIVWEETHYTSYILVNDDDAEGSSD